MALGLVGIFSDGPSRDRQDGTGQNCSQSIVALVITTQEDIQRIMTTLQNLQNQLNQQAGTARPPSPLGLTRPTRLQGPIGKGGDGVWSDDTFNIKDVSYFQSNLNLSASPGLIIHVSKDTYFCDMYLFVEQANNLIATKGKKVIQENLWLYLQGATLKWWISVLRETEKHFLYTKEGDSIIYQERYLTERFTMDLVTTIKVLYQY